VYDLDSKSRMGGAALATIRISAGQAAKEAQLAEMPFLTAC
jgi:hypothetical protein